MYFLCVCYSCFNCRRRLFLSLSRTLTYSRWQNVWKTRISKISAYKWTICFFFVFFFPTFRLKSKLRIQTSSSDRQIEEKVERERTVDRFGWLTFLDVPFFFLSQCSFLVNLAYIQQSIPARFRVTTASYINWLSIILVPLCFRELLGLFYNFFSFFFSFRSCLSALLMAILMLRFILHLAISKFENITSFCGKTYVCTDLFINQVMEVRSSRSRYNEEFNKS